MVEDLTIRGVDDETLRRLRLRAAENGRSLEQEVREVLRTVTGNRSDWILALLDEAGAAGGVDLHPRPRVQTPREVRA